MEAIYKTPEIGHLVCFTLYDTTILWRAGLTRRAAYGQRHNRRLRRRLIDLAETAEQRWQDSPRGVGLTIE